MTSTGTFEKFDAAVVADETVPLMPEGWDSG